MSGSRPHKFVGLVHPGLVVVNESTERLIDEMIIPPGARIIAIGSPDDPSTTLHDIFKERL